MTTYKHTCSVCGKLAFLKCGFCQKFFCGKHWPKHKCVQEGKP